MYDTHPTSANESPLDALLGTLARLREDAAGPLRAHRFGHDHDHDEADGAGDESDQMDDVLAAYREKAADVHERVAHDHGVSMVEFLGATGSGKTRLLERLIERAPDDERIGVVVGDVAGDDDARRLRDLGVAVANVNTGKECHLDPDLLEGALGEFDLGALDTLYVENVGNMVCPADFPLGAGDRILVVSTTEGDDVVRKHPLLFQACDAAVVNKVDIAAAVGADVDAMTGDIAEIAPDLPVFRTSARDIEGIDALESYLAEHRTHDHGHADPGAEPAGGGEGAPPDDHAGVPAEPE